MNLENLEVKHKAFGPGVIVSTQGKYITVKFESATKVFVYPDIFEKFLTLADGSVCEEILCDLSSTNEAKKKIVIRLQNCRQNIVLLLRRIMIMLVTMKK